MMNESMESLYESLPRGLQFLNHTQLRQGPALDQTINKKEVILSLIFIVLGPTHSFVAYGPKPAIQFAYTHKNFS